jgi:phosphatidylserine decarboxylase
MSVGRIVQVHPLDRHFERGVEKSVFKFGGSAVMVFGEVGAWSPSNDILQQTGQGVETLVRLGDCIASRAGV